MKTHQLFIGVLLAVCVLLVASCAGSSPNGGDVPTATTASTSSATTSSVTTGAGSAPSPEEIYTQGLVFKPSATQDGYTVSAYTGNSRTVVIPAVYEGKNVVAIGNEVFYERDDLLSVSIPEGVKSIGARAFFGCSSLAEIALPSGVTSLGAGAFKNCSGLSSLTLPSALTRIGAECFSGCSSLARVTLHEEITTVEADAFLGCSALNEIHISDIAAFCKIDFATCAGNPTYPAGGGLYTDGAPITDLVLPDSLTELKAYTFSGNKALSSLTVPNSIKKIHPQVFCGGGEGLVELTLPFVGSMANGNVSVSYLGCIFGATEYKTQGSSIPSSLKSVTITGGSTLYNGAFYACSNLLSVKLPNSIVTVGRDVFAGCSRLAFCEKDGGMYLGNEENPYVVLVKAKADVVSFAAAEGVQAVAEGAFAECAVIESLTLPFIGPNQDNGAGLYRLFAKSAVSNPNINLPATLKTVKITAGSYIGYEAFYYCENIAEIELAESIHRIESMAFAKCSKLERLYISSMIEEFDVQTVFGNVSTALKYNEYEGGFYLGSREKPYTVLMKVASSSVVSFKVHEDARLIDKLALDNCTELTEITLSDALHALQIGTFADCTSLVGLAYGGTYYIGSETNPYLVLLRAEVDITNCTVHEKTRFISDSAFAGCRSLQNVVLPSGLEVIGTAAFKNCSALQSVDIPAAVRFIGSTAFMGCSSLAELRFEEPEGWEKCMNLFFAEGSTYSFSDAQDAEKAATRLTREDCMYHYRRKR